MCIHRRDVTPGPVFGVKPEPEQPNISQWLCRGEFNAWTIVEQLPIRQVMQLAYTVVRASFESVPCPMDQVHRILRQTLTYNQLLAIQEVADDER